MLWKYQLDFDPHKTFTQHSDIKIVIDYQSKLICLQKMEHTFHIYVMVEPVESPIEVSTKFILVETPVGLSTGRNSNQGDLGTALGSEI